MWALLLLIGAVNALPASVERYLGNVDATDFYKVRVTGNMTSTNVKAACENAGMRIPCYYTGYDRSAQCTTYWSSECVKIDGSDVSCRTLAVLSQSICGTSQAHDCRLLDDIFVYHPNWQDDDSAWGVDHETSHWGMQGANYTDKYALCAVQQKYLTTWDGWIFYKVRVAGYLSNSLVKLTCEHAGMSHPCWYTGHGSCTTSTYWNTNYCIRFDHAGVECETTEVLSYNLCGTTDAKSCLPLDDTFLYVPGSSSCYGINYGDGSEGSNQLSASGIYDKYALCAAAQCHSSPCVHGECVQYPSNAVCWCDDGWTGVHCETLIDSCESSPCKSGGTCQDEENGYSCICPPKMTGPNCEEVIGSCESSPCMSGGTCQDKEDGYSCACSLYTVGQDCETVFYHDKCYWFSNDSLPNKEASGSCGNMEGHLANVGETAEQQLLASSMNPGRLASFWIANRISPFSCGIEEGSTLSATSWMYKSRAAYLDDICVLLDSSVGYLGTYQSCQEQHQYVCESRIHRNLL
ncbi:JAG1 [Branchiostoma lanceolatum]|uniref:JAG1 protein n=1 Tax=Branchiostoma lanceolatum TaxID=7740 RepID=A0A8K0EKB9_BRALA|nr:JAG1 [Branchiostoma lanceolatum]